jgi:5-methylcytosine-specific restriction protein A
MDWTKVIFLHTGWAEQYDGTEAPIGGHAYLKNAIGVEAENFKPIDGWCYGYAPVGRAGESRGARPIPKGSRTLNIRKLGARPNDDFVEGIAVVWTARRPGEGPVIVGLYDNATVLRSMPRESEDYRPFIAKARASDSRLLPTSRRTFAVIHKKKGFPGMAAAWFPGEHEAGPAHDFLMSVAEYIPTIRKFDPISPKAKSFTDQ